MKMISIEKLINELEKYSSLEWKDETICLQEKNLFFTNIAKDQENIFLSATMTGNLQLLRLEHIGCFRYNSKGRIWEAVLCDNHVVQLKRDTNAEKILGYHPHLIQINQSVIINISYLVLIKDSNCVLLPPFDKIKELEVRKPFMKRLKEKFPSI